MQIYVGPAGVPISCPKKDTISGIKCVYNLGLNLMEIQFVRGVKMREDVAEQIAKISQELGIRLTIHAPYYINLASDDSNIVERSIKEWIYESVKLASLMGAKCVVFHPAAYGEKSPEETYRIVRNNVMRVLDLTSDFENVYLCPETTGKGGQFGSFEEIIKLVEEIDHLRLIPCIDFAHIHARTGGTLKTTNEFIAILDRYYKFISRRPIKIIHIHFSCIEYTEKGERAHLALEARDPAFENLAEALKNFKFDEVQIVSESPILEQDALLMRNILVNMGLMKPIVIEKPIEIVKKVIKKVPRKALKAKRVKLKGKRRRKSKKSARKKKAKEETGSK
ncbi:MAG: TIM barrel protein [Crenarchaeota archaeon]|nr:TIM barrel protein [Thermoproteota archaeon]MCR8455561.1 TIM barrel protein [Thermoproteota archaeon]MCR8501645.1 TIM barrel protein [Thermoproteota archaeon]